MCTDYVKNLQSTKIWNTDSFSVKVPDNSVNLFLQTWPCSGNATLSKYFVRVLMAGGKKSLMSLSSVKEHKIQVWAPNLSDFQVISNLTSMTSVNIPLFSYTSNLSFHLFSVALTVSPLHHLTTTCLLQNAK